MSRAMPITGSGCGIILTSAANTRFLIPGRSMCVCSSKNYGKRNKRRNSRNRLRMHCLFILRFGVRNKYNKTPLAQINTEKTVTAATPSTPSNHNSPYPPLILRGGGEAGGVTIKGESSTRTAAAQRSSSRTYSSDNGFSRRGH